MINRESEMVILVLGATGILGNAVFRSLSATHNKVYGTIRKLSDRTFFNRHSVDRLLPVSDLGNLDELKRLFHSCVPQLIINCIAVGRSPLPSPARLTMIHSVLPQRLAFLCRQTNSRLIHVSSDGVFTGATGLYTEGCIPDAEDAYGLSKFLGEVEGDCTVTLRTSLIGHELHTKTGLLEWFLAQQTECRGYKRAIFSGFPSIVLANILRDHIVPREDLSGVYHVASEPISKFDLLTLIAERYGKSIRIIPDETVSNDRSLNSARFRKITNYSAPTWPQLVDAMYRDNLSSGRA